METLLQDLRYAARTLLKSPGFTLVAVLTLGLGIGAITTMFSVVNGVILEPLAYQQADRLVNIASPNRGSSPWVRTSYSFPDFRDLRAQTHSFAQLGTFRYWLFNLSGQDAPEAVLGVYAGDDVFEGLRVRPAYGTSFTRGADDKGHPREALLSFSLWRRRYGSDAAVVGTSIVVDGAPATVVGVLPRGFRFPELVPANTPLPSREPDIYMPVGTEPQGHDDRGNDNYWVIGRLAPGVTLAQAASELDAFAKHQASAFPNTDANLSMVPRPLKDQVVGDASRPLVILLGAVAFVLLIACANVGGLLLARAAGREREIAVRTALGASSTRLARQLLTESILLSLMGGVLGVVLTTWGLQGLRTFAPATLPRVADVTLDGRVLGFTLATSLLSGLFFGLWPVLRRDQRTNDALREGGRHSWTKERRRLRAGIVIAEVALSIVLLTGAGLLLRSFGRLASVNPGFEGKGVMTMFSLIPPSKYPTPESWSGYERTVLARLRDLPGVIQVGAINTLPLSNIGDNTSVDIIDHPAKTMGDMPTVGYRIIAGDYFSALRIPVALGRGFTLGDSAGAPPVAVINQSAARLFYPGENPVGRKLHLMNGDTTAKTIVGVMGDTHGEALDVAAAPEVSYPYQQGPEPIITLVIRAQGDPHGLVPAIKRELTAVDPQLPYYAVRTMDDLLSASLAQRRFDLELLAGFATAAMLLAGLGLYGVIAYSVTQRTQEIGVRMALGAERNSVVGLVIGDGLRLTAAGLGAGLIAAALLSRVLRSQLYGVGTLDPVAYAGVVVVFALVALAASYIPARRAAGVDPIVALRTE